MKEQHSFEKQIRQKMGEFSEQPSPHILEQLLQAETAPYSSPKKSFINMKTLSISILGMSILITGIYLFYTPLSEEVENNKTVVSYLQNISEAQEISKKENKPILLKVTMEGCTFCGKMEKNTFLQSDVQNAITNDFIIVDLDIKDPSLQPFFKRYKISAAPISLFINGNGKELQRVVGYQDKEIYLEAIEYALENNINHHPDSRHGEHNSESFVTDGELFKNSTDQKNINSNNDLFKHQKNPLELKVYPNPNNGDFKLDINGLDEHAFLYFSDSNGNVLLKEKIEGTPFARTLEYHFPQNNEAIFLNLEQGDFSKTEKILIRK